jgi:hypothetical protein
LAVFLLLAPLSLPAQQPGPESVHAEPVQTDAAAGLEHPVIDGLEGLSIDDLRLYFPTAYRTELQSLFELVPGIADEIRADLSPDAFEGVVVYFLRDIGDYERTVYGQRRSPVWARGLALLQTRVVLIQLDPTPGGRVQLDRTFAHELSHVGLRQYVRDQKVPMWLYEGFALLQTEDWTLERIGPLAEAATMDRLLPLWTLNDGFPRSPAAAALAYSESAHFLRWIIQRHGRERFRNYLANIRAGQSYDEAFESAYGVSFYSVESVWRAELGVGNGWLALFVGSTTIFFAIAVIFAGVMVRVKHRRRRALSRIESPPSELPPHLRNFGPFG